MGKLWRLLRIKDLDYTDPDQRPLSLKLEEAALYALSCLSLLLGSNLDYKEAPPCEPKDLLILRPLLGRHAQALFVTGRVLYSPGDKELWP
jgi:hypothetical protein